MTSKESCIWRRFTFAFGMRNPVAGESFIGATVKVLHLACRYTYTIFLRKCTSAAYVIASLIFTSILIDCSYLLHVVVASHFCKI